MRRLKYPLFFASLALCAFVTAVTFPIPAFAQDVGDAGGWIGIFAPVLQTVIAIAIPAILAWGAKAMKDRAGIELERSHRDALQSALANAARLALGRAAGRSAGVVTNVALDYVKQSVPDALAHFGLADDDRRLTELVEPHLTGTPKPWRETAANASGG